MRLPSVVLLLVVGLTAAASARDRGADGAFERRSSSHFDLHQDVDIDRAGGVHGSVEFERAVLDVLEAGYDGIDRWLGLRPRRRLTVVVYDAAIFDQTFAGILPFPAAGFYQGIIRVRGDVVVTASLQRTLLHELVHAAFDAEAPSLALPAWLNEGLSEWFAARATRGAGLSRGELQALAGAARAGGLPSLASLSGTSFAGFGPEGAGWAYLYSHGLVDHVVRQRGERDLRRACQETLRTGDIQRAFRKTTRATPAEHDAAFRRELSGR